MASSASEPSGVRRVVKKNGRRAPRGVRESSNGASKRGSFLLSSVVLDADGRVFQIRER